MSDAPLISTRIKYTARVRRGLRTVAEAASAWRTDEGSTFHTLPAQARTEADLALAWIAQETQEGAT